MSGPTPGTYTLYGAPISLYAGKARSYLRKQGIDFTELAPGHERFSKTIVPAVGRWIIPCLETPDGDIIQDGADIIAHFERGPAQNQRRFSATPEPPVLLAISHLFELFGGEGLLRPAMHYRWNFDDENLAFLTAEFGLLTPNELSPEQKEQAFLHASGRMRKAATVFGVTQETGPLIEDAFLEWLELFSNHLKVYPYLLGGRPTLGDFGLIAAMWAHLFRDPAPQSLIKRHAPRVGRWVERMTTTEAFEHEYSGTDELVDDVQIPETLLSMMRFVAEEYLSEISAHVDAANAWLAERPDVEVGTNGTDNPAARGLTGGGGLIAGGSATFKWRGQEITTGVMPYRFWLLQHLHDDIALAPAPEQTRIREVFRAGGLEPILDLRTHRRVERANHLEVWGPAK